MLLKFSKWMENSEVSVSEPQHKKGEDLLTLNKVVEKRMVEMINEFQLKGKAKPEDIFKSIAYFLDKNLPKNNEIQQNPPEQPNQ
jgi:hypothetical protein